MDNLVITREVLASIRNSRDITLLKRQHEEKSKLLLKIEIKNINTKIDKEFEIPITYKNEIPKKFYYSLYNEDWIMKTVLSHIKLNDQIRICIRDIKYNDELSMCEIFLIIERNRKQFVYLLHVTKEEFLFH